MTGPGPSTRRAVLAAAVAVQVALAASAWADLAHRGADEVRGPKWLWGLTIGVNFAGPLLYWRFGRRGPALVPLD
ncbi:PLDc N-terminal domain-containing protein [Qaidamihabitans albus]|uniref:PLDc N-terminal domain-containing protein n=1 Tax=Qaidamihabitans albus TaxID=2795733 RepID=UPI0018F1B828|nr:PLDc N-terminal domain-containing protein [Qaidamihabitans albus]